MSDSELSSLGSDNDYNESQEVDSGDEEVLAQQQEPSKKAPPKKRRHVESESDEDDEDEEDEDEEEEEEETKRKKKKRRRGRPKGSDFILDDVDVDDDDDEEGFAEDGDDFGIDPRERDEAEKAIREQERMNAPPKRRQLFEGMNEAEVEAYFNERYSNDQGGPMSVGDAGGYDEITQHSLMPSTKDPNLWIVKCRMGEERAVALQLMRKFISYQRTQEPLQIRSVVVKEGLKGIIYIEAFKKTHVAQAIEGISALSSHEIKMVAIKEMVETLKVVKDIPHIKKGAYVRLKRTLYKEDLAQVDWVDMANGKVNLKIVPRIDYTKKRGALRDPDEKKQAFQKFKRRPLPKLLDMDKIKEIGGDVTMSGDYNIFEGGHYLGGFLYKVFPLDSIMTDGIKPSLTELEKFQSSSDDFKRNLEETKIKAVMNVFVPGDVVEVVDGELMNLRGVVQSVDGEQIVMLPDHEDLKEPLTISSHELKKFFKTGDHIKVIGGRYQGDTGLIVAVQDKIVIFISDLTSTEFKVRAADAQLCADVTSGVDQLGQFQYQDLIQIDQRTVGVIVRMERDTVEVLDQHGKLQKIKPQAIRCKKDTRNAVALDSEQNTIRVKDMVKIIEGPNAPRHDHDEERQGEIKFVYRSSIFLHCKKITENGGVVVCRPKQLILVGGTKDGAKNREFGGGGGFKTLSSPNPFQSPRIHGNETPAHSMNEGFGGGRSVRGNQTPRTNGSQTPRVGGFGGGRGGGGGGFGGPRGGGGGRTVRRDTSLIGKSIRIQKGPFKGHFGIVKDCTEEMARVELHANCKTINVDRSHVCTAGDATNSSMPATMYEANKTPRPMDNANRGSKTPMYSSAQTPMYGAQTPMHDGFGGRTPHYGNQTPAYEGSRTPLHSGSNWDPNVPNTPAHNSSSYEFPDYDDDVDAPTPGSMNPHTPGFTAADVNNDFNPMTPGGMYSDYAAPSPYPSMKTDD